MFWLLLGMVVLLVIFDALITARRRPQWKASAQQAHQHIRRVAPESEKARMDEDSFVKHYLELCQKATTPARLGVIAGLGMVWLVYTLAAYGGQESQPPMIDLAALAVIIVAVPSPVVVKMVGVRQAKKFAQPPAEARQQEEG